MSQVLDRVLVSSVMTVGRATWLALSAVRYLVIDLVRLRLRWRECAQQAWILFTVTAFPAALMAIPFGAVITVQTGGLLHDVGASSMAGAASGMGVVRMGAPIAACLLMGGAASSAIASDLGTRAIREEVDAMRTMGIDPVRWLVVPRLVAMLIISPMILATIIVVGVATSFGVAILVSGVSVGSFWSSFGAFANVTDLQFALVKTVLGGVIVAIVASVRGLEARGGPRGVADAVNAAVVMSIVLVVLVTLVLTQIQTMFFPGQFA